MVDENHTELGLKLHRFGEHLNKLVHKGLTFRYVGIVYKDNTLSVFLDRSPALFVFEIAGNVPELQIYFTETGHGWWGVTFAFDNATGNSRTVEFGYTFGKFSKHVGDGGFPAPLGPHN